MRRQCRTRLSRMDWLSACTGASWRWLVACSTTRASTRSGGLKQSTRRRGSSTGFPTP
ncbi:hypothetical protein PF007_g31668 [Phytophthora fragariae]|uniref:Uncharacterized protein n=1 Tax=Phytophthora fragariae TaxID=53985 RepID=A0A6A3PMY9_9STRA|nr:hypothetical protein PF007_g31668 [Phytophthora fragariae]KAE9061809.1 hypothetical protein PF006_g31306 [Phytophthora fragariae]